MSSCIQTLPHDCRQIFRFRWGEMRCKKRRRRGGWADGGLIIAKNLSLFGEGPFVSFWLAIFSRCHRRFWFFFFVCFCCFYAFQNDCTFWECSDKFWCRRSDKMLVISWPFSTYPNALTIIMNIFHSIHYSLLNAFYLNIFFNLDLLNTCTVGFVCFCRRALCAQMTFPHGCECHSIFWNNE